MKVTRKETEMTSIPKRSRDAAIAAAAGDDELLTIDQTAAWLGLTPQWLKLGRSRGSGPPFERLGARTIRYRAGAVREWLGERSHRCTAEYRETSAMVQS
jgi:predicted DNA-binding transcriptional regulator AlpA